MRRWVWADAAAAEYARRVLAFPGLRQVLRVDRLARFPDGSSAGETRYFATSLGPGAVTPGRLLDLVRGHWGIENRLHYIKDRWWDEDRQYCTRPGLGERLGVLRNAVLTVLGATAEPGDGRPVRARADELGWALPDTLAWFTGQTL